MEKYSPNWLLDKLNNSKTDTHKLMHIIDFQNNVGLHNVSGSFSADDMEESYNDGAGINKPREFNIENYR
jgi:hypothetical protein